MPSTYSPDLRIELIANGEQSGTWGNTTNTNLGTLIEDAVAGYVSVSVTSANQALTANNGAADQARNMVVNLTTTTSANFNVYAPPASKFYVIRNSSAYQATIYCSTVIGNTTAAGTGVVIPASSTTIIFADGTNVASALNYLSAALPAVSGGTGQTSYTIGDLLYANTATTLAKLVDVATGNALISGGVGVAPSYGKIGLTTHVSGTLPVANGGTGVTTSTGSGSVVLSTSPTLVTPLLGTPTSGNLANCTFPTLNQNTTGTAANVTGTVAVANGGTGATTAANARTNLGLGSIATQDANNVSITGGSITSGSISATVTATAPTVSATDDSTNIATTAFVRDILPSGVIVMWSGSIVSIPSGWLLCNGASGTPDLRDRFVVGAGSTYAVAATGGSANAIVVSHTHTATVTDPGHFHTINTSGNITAPAGAGAGQQAGTTSTVTTGITVSNSTTGSSGTNANLPPYYALAYIMKT